MPRGIRRQPPVDPFEAENRAFDNAYDELVEEMLTIHDTKRNDYTGGQSRLHNYEASAALIGIPTLRNMLSRLHEKVVRVANLTGATTQQVKDESIEDTLLDIANIALLMAAAKRSGLDLNG